MGYLCKEQDTTPPPPQPSLPSSDPKRPLKISVNGFRSTAATVPGIRCNLYVRGPIHKDGAFRCNKLEYYGGKDGRLVPEKCFQRPRTTGRCRFGSRESVCVQVHVMTTEASGSERKRKHGISPSVRWTDGADEPDDRTITEDLLRLSPGRLEPTASPGRVCVQQWQKRLNRYVSLLRRLRIPPPSDLEDTS